MNYGVVMGRLVDEVKNNDIIDFKIGVKSPWKDERGCFDTEIISCKLYDDTYYGYAEYKNMILNAKKGDLIAVKGKLSSKYSSEVYLKVEKITTLQEVEAMLKGVK